MHTLPCPLQPQSAVVTRILRQLRANPTMCALQFRARCISNVALLDKVLRLVQRFAEIGIRSDIRVAVCMERCPEHLVVLLALWQRGAVYVAFDAALPRERLLDMCSVAEVSILLTQPHLQPLLATLPVNVVTLADMDFGEPRARSAEGGAEEHPLAELSPDIAAAGADATTAEAHEHADPVFAAPAYILFTSGSTGVPKGVLISQRNLAALFSSVAVVLPSCAGKRVLACAAYGFDIALFELLTPLLCGGTIVLADQETSSDPQLLASLIVGASVDVIQATPSLWQLLNRYDWNPERRALLALATGEALPRSLATAILRRTPLLWNLYGPTECTIWASAHQVSASDVSEQAPAIVSIGRALPHIVLELCEAGTGAAVLKLPDKASACANGESRSSPAQDFSVESAGVLWIGGDGVGAGYCGAAALTQAAFTVDNDAASAGNSGPPDNSMQPNGAATRWYRSGDLCRRAADGNLHFLGRLDSQVKVNGYRIELNEITRLLLQHASILNAICLTRVLPDARGTLLFACVVFIPGMPNKNRHGLNQYLARFLPAWMLPHRYYFLNELPLTSNGKVDRAALLALAAPAREPDPDSAAQRSANLDGDTLRSGSAESPHHHESTANETDLDRRVTALFCEVLDITSIGPCDSFLDLGGSSMLSATLVMLLNQRFGTRLTLRQALATPPTVQSIVKLLTEAGLGTSLC